MDEKRLTLRYGYVGSLDGIFQPQGYVTIDPAKIVVVFEAESNAGLSGVYMGGEGLTFVADIPRKALLEKIDALREGS